MENKENISKGSTIKIRVKPGSSIEKLTWNSSYGLWELSLKAPPVEGKANKALKDYFKKREKLNAEIIRGEKSKEKLIKFI